MDKALTGRCNLDLHARLWGIPASVVGRKIAELTEAFGLSEVIGRPVDTYSGGQRRRLEIARALVSEPRVLPGSKEQADARGHQALNERNPPRVGELSALTD